LGFSFHFLSGSSVSESWEVMRPSTDMTRKRVVWGRVDLVFGLRLFAAGLCLFVVGVGVMWG
jgi:hypothetical protein